MWILDIVLVNLKSILKEYMRTKARKTCGPNLVSKIRDLTNVCYRDAKEFILSNMSASHKQDLMTSDIFDPNQVRELKSAIDDQYLENIKKLSTQELEDILWVHHNGKLRRAERTIETIVAEIARRELMDDDGSDTNYS